MRARCSTRSRHREPTRCSRCRYLNDLILIVRTVRQIGIKIAINGGSGGFVMPEFLQERRQGGRRTARRRALESRPESEDAQKVNVEFKKRTGEFAFEYAGGLVAQTFMLADALANAQPRPIRRRCARHCRHSMFPSGFAAMAPGGKVKFGPDGKNVYGRPVGVQWQNADFVSVFPKEDARAPLLKT